MSKDIILSPKHGVNPSLGICYFCGQENGEVVLPGKLPGDAEAPRRAVWHKEPCPQCVDWMKQGIIFIGVKEEDPTEEPTRTGRFAVLREDAVQRMIKDPDMLEHVLEKRMCFIPDTVWDAVGLPMEPEVTPPPDAA